MHISEKFNFFSLLVVQIFLLAEIKTIKRFEGKKMQIFIENQQNIVNFLKKFSPAAPIGRRVLSSKILCRQFLVRKLQIYYKTFSLRK